MGAGRQPGRGDWAGCSYCSRAGGPAPSDKLCRALLLLAMAAAWVSAAIYVAVELGSSSLPSAAEWMWCGGVTATSATFRVLTQGEEGLVFVLSLEPDLSAPSAPPQPLPAGGGEEVPVARVEVEGLSPATRYYYGPVCSGGAVAPCSGAAAPRGTFRTAPLRGSPVTLAFASCADTGSRSRVFRQITAADPDVFVHMGDLHYLDIGRDDPALYRRAMGAVFGSPAQRHLFSRIPVAYMWDDHDFGENDSSSSSPSRPAALVSYRANVPHYPLPADAEGGADGGVYQAFSIGGVRVVMTDLRSEAASGGRIMSARQKEWLLRELGAAGQHAAVVWVSTVPWIGEATAGGDAWSGHAEERAEISAFIAANVTRGNLVMISGDAHMVALDDGAHSGYSPSGGGGFPVVQMGPLDRTGSSKGGPYSHGCHGYVLQKGHHFGLLTVTEGGGSECVTVEGRDASKKGEARRLFSYSTCAPFREGGEMEGGLGACPLPYYPDGVIALLGAGLAMVLLAALALAAAAWRWGRSFWSWSLAGLVLFASLDVLLFGLPMYVSEQSKAMGRAAVVLPGELLGGLWAAHGGCVLACLAIKAALDRGNGGVGDIHSPPRAIDFVGVDVN